MEMYNSREATIKAAENFPRWMDVRKRLYTSTGGKYLQSIFKEQDDIKAFFEDFKNTFFLEHYLGHEDDILCQVYVAHVGKLDEIISQNLLYEMTTDPYQFMGDTKNFSLYQDEYVIIDPVNVDINYPIFLYKSHDQVFSITLEKKDLWNIFDEFALFSSLERYEGETNSHLTQRILATFKKPTNGTETGLKNSITNALINYTRIKPSEIKLEQPDGENMHMIIEGGKSIYEAMSAINKDIAREKVWNQSYWENNFKKTQYIPNVWDIPLKGYQDGTGQRHDLETKLSTDYANLENTNLEIIGYEASVIKINKYIRKQGIKRNIPLQLLRYRNELVAKKIRYKITAMPAMKIEPTKIFIQSLRHATGNNEIHLSDIIVDKGATTEVIRGNIQADKLYTLKFKPRKSFDNMIIEKCDFIDNKGRRNSLLISQGAFQLENGVVRNTDVKAHISSISSASNIKNIVDNESGGITIGQLGTKGSFSLNVFGMDNMPISIKTSCEKTDYTSNTDFVKLFGGFRYKNNKTKIICDTEDSTSQVIIEMNCASLSYDLALADTPNEQGTISVLAEIDGVVNPEFSGLKTVGKTYEIGFDNLHHVKLTITKTGLYPVVLRNIRAARYRLRYSLSKKDIIYTQNYMKLPTGIEQGTLLNVIVESFSTFAPVIEYLHIGPSMELVSYDLKNISSGTGGGDLDIRTNCRVELYRIDEGKEVLVNEDYITRSLYRNDTSNVATIYIDTSEFVSIRYSSRPILSGAYHGKITSYIELRPGETVDSLFVNGERRIIQEKYSLSRILKLDPLDKLYIAGNMHGFIVLTKNNDTRLIQIKRDSFNRLANEYQFIDLPENTTGVFAINQESKNIANVFSGDFSGCYISPVSSQDYVAYNEAQLLLSPMDGIKLANTFSPYLDMNRLMTYYIDEINTEDKGKPRAKFIHANSDGTEYVNWALGANHKGIRAEYDFDYSNVNDYQLTVDNLNESFTISNSIDLKEEYTQDGRKYILARYIIRPPEHMKLTYATDTVQEDIIIEEDGFNKLYFSNVRKILSVTINDKKLLPEEYLLINEAGILVWNKNKQFVGQRATVIYEYRKPRTLEYKDLSYLYEMVGYSTDAYEPLNEKPIILTGVGDGETRTVVIEGKIPDKITVKCSNNNFYATVTKNNILVQKYSNAAVAIVHAGYFYDKGKEYFMYEHDKNEIVDSFENIDAKNVERIADTIRTRQRSSNHLKDSIMTNGDHLEELCHVDCVEDQSRIKGISDLRSFTACDTYQLWNDFNMEINIEKGYNGNGLKFKPRNSLGYAYFELTPYAKKNIELSFIADKGIHAYIMREVFARDDSMRKSVYAEVLQECERNGEFVSYLFDDDIQEEHRYYLLLIGEGMVDDMIIREHDKNKTIEDIHHKNIDILYFNISETAQKDFEKHLEFDNVGNVFEDLEMDRAGLIETGSTVDWGVTLVKNFQEDFHLFPANKVDLRKNVFYTRKQDGEVTSTWTEIHDPKAVDTVYVKVNDMLLSSFQFFNIRLFTAEDAQGTGAREIAYTKKTNLLEIQPTSLLPFVQVTVEMPPERVINNIEIYVRYVENTANLHVSHNPTGSMVTKVYNTTAIGNYRAKYMTGSVKHHENIKIYMRGYRQDKDHGVWTEWSRCNFDEHMVFADNTHIFEQYQYFQFKIVVSDMNSNIKIDEIILEVV